MAFENCTPHYVDVCDVCYGFITYGTVGDWSYFPKQGTDEWESRVADDSSHQAIMEETLGVPVGNVMPAEGESWSSSPCEACDDPGPGNRSAATMFVPNGGDR